jgi:hypothetical protein
LVDLSYDDELEGEIWRSGKLHSDNPDELEALYGVRTRRIRESACTVSFILWYIFNKQVQTHPVADCGCYRPKCVAILDHAVHVPKWIRIIR